LVDIARKSVTRKAVRIGARVNAMRRWIFTALLLCCSLFAERAGAGAHHLRRLLAEQGFSGELRGKVTIAQLGVLGCGNDEFQVFYYSWEESNPPGKAIHANYRILFLKSGNTYVGSYSTSDRHPKVKGREIRFEDSTDQGNVIACNEDGLPKTVVLDGERRLLTKRSRLPNHFLLALHNHGCPLASETWESKPLPLPLVILSEVEGSAVALRGFERAGLCSQHLRCIPSAESP